MAFSAGYIYCVVGKDNLIKLYNKQIHNFFTFENDIFNS